MNSEQLADSVEQAIQACRTRVLGVGDEQYSEGDMQKFERMALPDLFEWAHEELDDVIVYAVMLKIRMRRLQAEMDAHLLPAPHAEG